MKAQEPSLAYNIEQLSLSAWALSVRAAVVLVIVIAALTECELCAGLVPLTHLILATAGEV